MSSIHSFAEMGEVQGGVRLRFEYVLVNRKIFDWDRWEGDVILQVLMDGF